MNLTGVEQELLRELDAVELEHVNEAGTGFLIVPCSPEEGFDVKGRRPACWKIEQRRGLLRRMEEDVDRSSRGGGGLLQKKLASLFERKNLRDSVGEGCRSSKMSMLILGRSSEAHRHDGRGSWRRF